jgi:hypothetical protein
VHEITQSFKTISEEVVSIKQQLQQLDMGRLAECIHNVQLAEEDKLKQVHSFQHLSLSCLLLLGFDCNF